MGEIFLTKDDGDLIHRVVEAYGQFIIVPELFLEFVDDQVGKTPERELIIEEDQESVLDDLAQEEIDG